MALKNKSRYEKIQKKHKKVIKQIRRYWKRLICTKVAEKYTSKGLKGAKRAEKVLRKA